MGLGSSFVEMIFPDGCYAWVRVFEEVEDVRLDFGLDFVGEVEGWQDLFSKPIFYVGGLEHFIFGEVVEVKVDFLLLVNLKT